MDNLLSNNTDALIRAAQSNGFVKCQNAVMKILLEMIKKEPAGYTLNVLHAAFEKISELNDLKVLS